MTLVSGNVVLVFGSSFCPRGGVGVGSPPLILEKKKEKEKTLKKQGFVFLTEPPEIPG